MGGQAVCGMAGWISSADLGVNYAVPGVELGVKYAQGGSIATRCAPDTASRADWRGPRALWRRRPGSNTRREFRMQPREGAAELPRFPARGSACAACRLPPPSPETSGAGQRSTSSPLCPPPSPSLPCEPVVANLSPAPSGPGHRLALRRTLPAPHPPATPTQATRSAGVSRHRSRRPPAARRSAEWGTRSPPDGGGRLERSIPVVLMVYRCRGTGGPAPLPPEPTWGLTAARQPQTKAACWDTPWLGPAIPAVPAVPGQALVPIRTALTLRNRPGMARRSSGTATFRRPRPPAASSAPFRPPW